MHGAIFAYGIGLLDNGPLQPLAEALCFTGADRRQITLDARSRPSSSVDRPNSLQ